jgi:archaemetzincin
LLAALATVSPAVAWQDDPPVPDAGAAPAPRLRVYLVPLGDVAQSTIDETARGLRVHAPIDVVVEARRALPHETESSDKGRYRAEKLLDFLAKIDEPPSAKVVGVAEVDIVAHKGRFPNWGVLGLGSLDGRSCVLSTFRMKRRWEHGGAPDSVVRERLWKTSLHEVGHTLGLEHCPVRGCIMEDAHGTVRTTDGETELCPACARKLADAIARLGQPPSKPN